MIDCISGGRLIAGMVVGGGPEYYSFSLNPAHARERFAEAHDLILRVWTEPGPFEFMGKHYKLRYVNSWPRPIQQPHPEIWIPGVGSLETLEFVAKHHYAYMGIPYFHISVFERMFAMMREACQKEGYDADPLQLGWLVPIFVAETDAEARRRYEEHFWYFVRRLLPGINISPPGYTSVRSVGEHHEERRHLRPQPRQSWDEVVEGQYAIVGSPETVTELLAANVERLGVGNLLGPVPAGHASGRATRKRSLELFATEVMPKLRASFPGARCPARIGRRPRRRRRRDRAGGRAASTPPWAPSRSTGAGVAAPPRSSTCTRPRARRPGMVLLEELADDPPRGGPAVPRLRGLGRARAHRRHRGRRLPSPRRARPSGPAVVRPRRPVARRMDGGRAGRAVARAGAADGARERGGPVRGGRARSPRSSAGRRRSWPPSSSPIRTIPLAQLMRRHGRHGGRPVADPLRPGAARPPGPGGHGQGGVEPLPPRPQAARPPGPCHGADTDRPRPPGRHRAPGPRRGVPVGHSPTPRSSTSTAPPTWRRSSGPTRWPSSCSTTWATDTDTPDAAAPVDRGPRRRRGGAGDALVPSCAMARRPPRGTDAGKGELIGHARLDPGPAPGAVAGHRASSVG